MLIVFWDRSEGARGSGPTWGRGSRSCKSAQDLWCLVAIWIKDSELTQKSNQCLFSTCSSFQRCFSLTLLTTFQECEFRTHSWRYFSGYSVKWALAMSPLSTTFVKYRLLTESHLVYRPRSTSPLKGIFIPWMIHVPWWPWWAIQLPLNYIILQMLYSRTGPIP